MLDNGVRTIYTENIRDFAGLEGIEAVNPFTLKA
jgi:predicted nucleic acid-binding protein